MKSLAVALNPVPAIDVFGGTAVDATMVVTLGRVYGIEVTTANARALVTSILKAAGWGDSSARRPVSYASSFFKGLTLGAGSVLTMLPQGAAAGYGSLHRRRGVPLLLRARRELGRARPQDRRHPDPQELRQRIRPPPPQRRDPQKDISQPLRGGGEAMRCER